MRNFLVLGLCLSLIGCASSMSRLPLKPWSEPQYGMSEKQMFDLLGKPQSMEIYKKTTLVLVKYYFYVDSSGEKVPVCVMDKKVVGWGKTYYEDHESGDDVRIK